MVLKKVNIRSKMSSNSMSCSRTSFGGSYDRKLRYRTILENLSNLEDEDENNIDRMDKTSNAVKEAQVLLAEGGLEERVKHPGENYLDSRVLRATSDLSVRCAETVSGNINTYDKHELAAHIKQNPDYWSFVFPREVPPCASLFGTLAPCPEARPRAVRRAVQRQQATTLTAPQAVDKLDKVEEGSEMVSRVRKFLIRAYRNNNNTPLSYFHVVLDPGSFSRTVENIYNISFLVRDGLVAIDLDEEYELPFITPVSAAQQRQEAQDIAEENQFIVAIDQTRWKELIQAFKITQPMMVLNRL